MKKTIIIGFISGSIILPFIVVLGLIVPYVEYLSPLIILGKLASQPFIMQIDKNTFELPLLGWLVFGLVNGILYSGIFLMISSFIKKIRK